MSDSPLPLEYRILDLVHEIARKDCYACCREVAEPGWFPSDQRDHDQCMMHSAAEQLDEYFLAAFLVLCYIGQLAQDDEMYIKSKRLLRKRERDTRPEAPESNQNVWVTSRRVTVTVTVTGVILMIGLIVIPMMIALILI